MAEGQGKVVFEAQCLTEPVRYVHHSETQERGTGFFGGLYFTHLNRGKFENDGI